LDITYTPIRAQYVYHGRCNPEIDQLLKRALATIAAVVTSY